MDSQGFKFQNNLDKKNQFEINVFRNLSPRRLCQLKKKATRNHVTNLWKYINFFPSHSNSHPVSIIQTLQKGIIINGFPEKGAFNFISDYDRVIALKREYLIFFLRNFEKRNFPLNNKNFTIGLNLYLH